MKVCFKNLTKSFNPEQIKVIKKFLLFLQEEIPLNKDIQISLLEKRRNGMTTGQRGS